MKRKARFTEGVDVWTCDCGRVNIMGRRCSCGKTNADRLCAAKTGDESLPKIARRKPFSPISRSNSGLIESYLYRKTNVTEE